MSSPTVAKTASKNARIRLGRRGRVATIAVGTATIVAVIAVGIVLHRNREADGLVTEARARLDAPFVTAPTIDRLQASTAISLLDRARSMGRDDEETRGLGHYAEAIEDLQRGDLILAEGELAMALTHLGETPDLLVLAAALSAARFIEATAQAEIDRALAIAPDHARGRLLAADLALDRGDGALAQTHLEALAAAYDGSGAVWNRLGLAREQLGDRDGAEVAYRRATELDRQGQDAWINVGRLLRVAGRNEESLEAFETAVLRAPTDPAAHLGRGLARAATADAEGAAEDFHRAAELAPNDAEPLLAHGDLLRDLGRVEEAIGVYRQAIEREDADAASWLKLGNALALIERWDPAASAFEEAIERSPDLAAAHNGLGACWMRLDRDDDARTELERAALLDPGDPHPLMNLALLRERTGDTIAARLAWERVLERAPGSAIATSRIARLRG